MTEFVSRWLVPETGQTAIQRTDKTDKINSVSSVSASKRDLSRFSPATGFAPLDDNIIQAEASKPKNTLDEIRARLDHSRQMAGSPGAAPVWAQVVRDWTAILAAKERGTGAGEPPVEGGVS